MSKNNPRYGPRNRSLQDRFNVSYAACPMSGCWLWEGTLHNGYGMMRVDRKPTYAHRVSVLLSGRDIPKRMEVLHLCDNKPCVNPAHLLVGTHRENMLDAWDKGIVTAPPVKRNGAHPMAKLNEQQVDAIRAFHAKGWPQNGIAFAFDVCTITISNIVNGKTWKESHGIQQGQLGQSEQE